MTTPSATRPAAGEFLPYFATYIDKVPDGDVIAVLESGIGTTRKALARVSEERAGYRYAEGKWSIKEVLGHMSDTERIFTYRLLAFARGDAGPLPGFDENSYTPAQESDRVPFAWLLDEFVAVRAATLALLKVLPPKAWERRGVASQHPLSARAAAWIIAGHEIHHRRVLEERYLTAL
jgi:uncharacterized damage-inducible protein DinB